MYNKKEKRIRRGDLYYADLDPVRGSEQGGVRPVIVIQNNQGNLHSRTVIVASITVRLNKPNLPTHILIKEKEISNLKKDSIVILEHIRTIDQLRLDGYIGRLDWHAMQELDAALAVSVGLNI